MWIKFFDKPDYINNIRDDSDIRDKWEGWMIKL